ncbi:hypothetical protein ACU4GD_07930 [Cupriavidus basilensis]
MPMVMAGKMIAEGNGEAELDPCRVERAQAEHIVTSMKLCRRAWLASLGAALPQRCSLAAQSH